jgi:hypothetical protein
MQSYFAGTGALHLIFRKPRVSLGVLLVLCAATFFWHERPHVRRTELAVMNFVSASWRNIDGD